MARLPEGEGFDPGFAANVARAALFLFHSTVYTLGDMALRKIETSLGGLTRLNPSFFAEVALSPELCALLASLLETQLRRYLAAYFEVAHLEIFLSPSKETSATHRQLLRLLEASLFPSDPKAHGAPRFSALLCTCETFKTRTSVKTTIIEVLVLSLLASLKSDATNGPSEESSEVVRRIGFLLKLIIVFLDFQFDPAESFDGQRHPYGQVYTALLHRFFAVSHQVVAAAGEKPSPEKQALAQAVIELTADLVNFMGKTVAFLFESDPTCLDEAAVPVSARPDGRLDPKRHLCVTFSKQFLLIKPIAAVNQFGSSGNSKGFSQKPGFGFPSNKKKHLTLGSEVIAEPLLQPEEAQTASSTIISHLITKEWLLGDLDKQPLSIDAANKYLSENGVFSEREPSDRLHLNLEEMRRNFTAFVARTKSELQDKMEQRVSSRPEENKLARQIRLNVALS